MSNIKILKANEIGYGYLIEHDAGFIDPSLNDNKKFINEVNKLNVGDKIIEEPLYLYAVLQKYGVKNRNGRVYPKEILIKQAEAYFEYIRTNSAIGELNHPNDTVINLERISHNIVDMWWDGKSLIGKLEVIMSPGFVNGGIISCSGDMVANLIRKNIRIGVSSRGLGSVKNINGETVVQDDFELICWDTVSTPSTPGSYTFTKMEETKPFVESEIRENKNILIEKLNNFLNI